MNNENKISIENAFYKLNSDNKIELHFTDRNAYKNLSDETKKDIRSGFVWGRQRGAWCRAQKVVISPTLCEAMQYPMKELTI
jgi:hypothetical protein